MWIKIALMVHDWRVNRTRLSGVTRLPVTFHGLPHCILVAFRRTPMCGAIIVFCVDGFLSIVPSLLPLVNTRKRLPRFGVQCHVPLVFRSTLELSSSLLLSRKRFSSEACHVDMRFMEHASFPGSRKDNAAVPFARSGSSSNLRQPHRRRSHRAEVKNWRLQYLQKVWWLLNPRPHPLLR